MSSPKENNDTLFSHDENELDQKDNVVRSLSVFIIFLMVGFLLLAVFRNGGI